MIVKYKTTKPNARIARKDTSTTIIVVMSQDLALCASEYISHTLEPAR